MPKQTLVTLIKLMFLALVLVFLFVLFRSLGGPSRIAVTANLFDDVVIGQTAPRRVGSDKVWVTRLSSAQRNQINSINDFVIAPQAGCSLGAEVCVLGAATERSGIDVIYIAETPAQLPDSVPWFGGFVDPTTGAVFDRLGRAYRDSRVSGEGRIALDVLDVESK